MPAMIPGEHNFSVYQGDRYVFEVVLKNGPDLENLTPINLTGATVTSQIRTSRDVTLPLLGSFECVVSDGPAGEITLTLTPVVSETLPAQGLVYDVQVAFTPGVDDQTYLRGAITVEPQVTELP